MKKQNGHTPKAGKKPSERTKAASPLKNALWRLGAILVTCLLIFGAVLALVYRDTVSLDGIVRFFSYSNLERDEDGEPVPFSFSSDEDTAVALLDSDLVVSSRNGFQVFSVDGTLQLEQDTVMEQPTVQSAGTSAVVYDLGGNDLYLLRDRAIAFHYSTEERYSLLSARVNGSGMLTIAEETAGYKAAVNVYDASGNRLVTVNVSSAFVMDALVSDDGATLAVALISQQDADFQGAITFYDCATGEQLSSVVLGSTTILGLRWSEEALRVQLEDGVAVVYADGTVAGSWTNESQYLQAFSLNGLQYSAELMGKYRAGSTGQLLMIDSDGTEHASTGVREEVLSISAADRYVAVLTANRLTIYTEELEVYDETETLGATIVLMREDGSAMLVGNGSAQLYVP